MSFKTLFFVLWFQFIIIGLLWGEEYFKYEIKYKSPFLYGKNNTLILKIIPYFDLEKWGVEFLLPSSEKLFFNPLEKQQELAFLRKGKTYKFYFNIRYDREFNWAEVIKGKLKFSFIFKDKENKLERPFYLFFPYWYGGRANSKIQFIPFLYRKTLFFFLPPFLIKNGIKKIEDYQVMLNLINSWRKELSPFLIIKSNLLSKRYFPYLKSLYSLGFYFLMEEDYEKSLFYWEWFKREQAKFPRFLSFQNKFAFQINLALVTFLAKNKKKGLRKLNLLRKYSYFKKYKPFAKFLLFDLGVIYYKNGERSYGKLLLRKTLRYDPSFFIAKKFLKKFE